MQTTLAFRILTGNYSNMAIETQKILSVDTTGAVNSVKELKDEINRLRDAWLNAEEGSEQYESITKKLIEDQTKLNQVMSVGKNEASAATGSYNSLVNQMAALKRVWRETTSEVQRNQLGDKIRDINDQLKAYDATIGNHQRTVGAYEQALQTLNKQWDSQKQELAALKTALDNLDPSSQEYIKAFERAAEITHNLQERQEILRMSANDLGTQISNVANIGAGMAGMFNAVQGVMTLTGQKSENLTKAMAELQAGIAIVQGLRGIEGMNKSLKAYTTWAAKAYDRIKDMIAGHKAETKEIQASTTSLEANAAANNQVAAGEASAAAGANALGTGMKGAAAGTATATVAMTAFKAVLMSLGIGLVIAAVSGLIAGLSKLANAGKLAYEEAKKDAQDRYDLEQELIEKINTELERNWELDKARGAEEIEILHKRYDAYKEQLDIWAEMRNEADSFLSANTIMSGMTKQWAAPLANNKKLLEDYRRLSDKTITDLQVALENWEKKGNKYLKTFTIEAGRSGEKVVEGAEAAFDRIKEKGIRTFDDIYWVVLNYRHALKAEADAYDFDPLGGFKNDIKAEAATIIKSAENAVKSESALEKERYNQLVSSHTWTNAELQTLQREHWKKMKDIVDSATKSILDRVDDYGKDEIQILSEKYYEEFKVLQQYGKDTSNLTREFFANVMKADINYRTRTIENAIKELNRYAADNGPMAQAYDRLEAAGIATARSLAAKQEEIYEKNQFALEQQVEYWKKLYEEIKDNEYVTAEDRIAIHDRMIEAQNKLDKNRTDYLVQQIQTRKKAMDEEIDKIEKEYDEYARIQARANATPGGNYGENASFGGFMKYSFRGDAKTFKQGLQEIDDTYKIEIDQLQEMVEIYQKAANDINLSEEERTAAKKKEAEARGKIRQLEEDRELEHKKFVLQNYEDIQETILGVAQSVATILDSIYDTIQSSMQRQVNEGKMTEEEMEKQMEKYRWIQYTSTVITTARNAVEAYGAGIKTFPYNLPLGQILGIAGAAAAIAQGVAQLAAIKAASKSSTLGNAAAMQPTSIAQTEYQPDYSANLTNRSDTEYLRNAMSGVNLYVKVSDIDAAQTRVRVTNNESSF